ncbi:MAG: hypothetical protein ACLQSR_00075 [Limisphaerales bacterium]
MRIPFAKSFCLMAVLAPALMISLTGRGQQTPDVRQVNPPDLGQAAPAPSGLSLNPPAKGTKGSLPMLQPVTGGFSVNTDAREETRDFYNGLFPVSDNVPQDSTADASVCVPGHNSNAFQQAELLRLNWFRAMAGMPATISLNPIDNWGSQQMAVIMSENNVLNHNPPDTYTCYNTFAASYAGGDQALGADGAEATMLFIWDFGTNNSEVGHRRWILYPSETVMGFGDVPGAGTNAAANLTYVFDPASFGARPATRKPYVSWPPEGFVPYQVVFPYWSFALSNADFSAATVSMTSNGVPVATVIQPYKTGYGENTLVWVPMGLDGTQEGATFPFDGTDTVYSVTVGNITNNGVAVSYSYNVTVFDPAMPGADYIPTAMNGPAQAVAGAGTVYSAVAPNDPHVSSYNFLIAQTVSGNLFDDGSMGLMNFTLTPPPNYSVTTTEPFGSGSCFNLEHYLANSSPQFLQLNEELLPATNTVLDFESELGFATANEVARVQVSADSGANWADIYTQSGNGSYESSFTEHSLSLSNYAGTAIRLRFNYDYQGGEYNDSGFPLGWYFTDILITNVEALVNQVTNDSTVTNIISGDLVDSAANGLGNFTISPPPYYYAITNPPVGSEPDCFHLTHLDPAPQLMQFNEVLAPSAASALDFSSQLGDATSDETARVQASTNDGATWDDLFDEAGGANTPESSFTPVSLSLAAYAGMPTLLRFNFDFTGGSYDPQSDNFVGWNIEDIALTNVQQEAITTVDSTNFTFMPAQAGTYLLQAQPVIFGQFPLAFGPVKEVTVISNNATVISVQRPVLSGNQVLLNFNVSGGAGTFHLLQANQLTPPGWSTNTTAVIATNVPGSSYRFTVTNNEAMQFYRVQTP